jgi:hypothetical protein
LFGLARTMMEMFKVIVSLKVIIDLFRIWIIGIDDFGSVCT